MKVGKLEQAYGAVLLLALLAACGAPERRPDERVNLSGYSQSFKQGYSDGCESAGARVKRRDESRYKADGDYMMGWKDGYSVCQRRR